MFIKYSVKAPQYTQTTTDSAAKEWKKPNPKGEYYDLDEVRRLMGYTTEQVWLEVKKENIRYEIIGDERMFPVSQFKGQQVSV